jgi:hypothetical protein
MNGPDIRQITPEMLQRIRAAQAQQGAQPAPAPPTRENSNPLAEGEEGLRVLRAFSTCPIPDESKKVNALLQKGLTLQNLTEVTEDALGKSVVTILRANRHCEENLRTRVVCEFAKDDVLAEIDAKLRAENETLTRLQKEGEECVQRGEELAQRRWDTAVKNFGLNPEKYSYRINEGAGTIELVDLDCDRCKGPVALRKMRQELTAVLMDPGCVKEQA